MGRLVTTLVLLMTLLAASGCAGLRRLSSGDDRGKKADEPATVNEWLSQPRPGTTSDD